MIQKSIDTAQYKSVYEIVTRSPQLESYEAIGDLISQEKLDEVLASMKEPKEKQKESEEPPTPTQKKKSSIKEKKKDTLDKKAKKEDALMRALIFSDDLELVDDSGKDAKRSKAKGLVKKKSELQIDT